MTENLREALETRLVRNQVAADVMERVVIGGDLAKLTSPERLMYYKAVCESVGLNPLTKPFEYITLNQKLTLYAKRDATDQLRQIHGVSITKLERDKHDDLYVVTAYATDAKGRTDAATGAVATLRLSGDALANAIMKAETKAKRRVTLSLCGLGLLDETEVGTIPGALIGEPTSVVNSTPPPAIGDPTRPMSDPETLEARAEAAALLPTPEDDERSLLIEEIQSAGAKLTKAQRGRIKELFLGSADADLRKADTAALDAILKHLRELHATV